MINLGKCPSIRIKEHVLTPSPFAKIKGIEVIYLKTGQPLINLPNQDQVVREPGVTITQTNLELVKESLQEQEQLIWFSVATSGVIISIIAVRVLKTMCVGAGNRIMNRCFNRNRNELANPAHASSNAAGCGARRSREQTRQPRERQPIALRALPAPRTSQ